MKLKTGELLAGRGIGRAPEESRESANMAYVILPCMLSQPPDEHVIEHALAEWADRFGGRNIVHGKVPLALKEPLWSGRGSACLNASLLLATAQLAPIPRSGFVQGALTGNHATMPSGAWPPNRCHPPTTHRPRPSPGFGRVRSQFRDLADNQMDHLSAPSPVSTHRQDLTPEIREPVCRAGLVLQGRQQPAPQLPAQSVATLMYR